MIVDIFQSWWEDFWSWAWARHHNILSWYIRPLFLFPYCYAAYHHSLLGITTSVIALATSMFWFPPPANPNPAVLLALQAEKEYLLGPWQTWKTALALIVPLTFTLLALAFWNKSFWWGVGVVNTMVIIKILWTAVFFTKESAFYHLVTAITGLLVCDLLLVLWRFTAGEKGNSKGR